MIPEVVELYVRLCGKGIPKDYPDRLEQALERVVQRTSAIVRAARIRAAQGLHDSAFNPFLIQIVRIGCVQLPIIYPVV